MEEQFYKGTDGKRNFVKGRMKFFCKREKEKNILQTMDVEKI